MKELQQTLKKMYQHQKILIATSGGVDSMALLSLAHKAELNISACYINHRQRPKEITQEIMMLRLFCEQHHIPFFCLSIAVADLPTENKQAVFRKQRYNLLVKQAEFIEADTIMTGHHQSDQAETILMRLVKNYDVLSLSGIQYSRSLSGIEIVRPLLAYAKSSSLEYCKTHNIEYCEDSSNKKTMYLRNRLRDQVMPIFETENALFQAEFIAKMMAFQTLYQDKYQQLRQQIGCQFAHKTELAIKDIAEYLERQEAVYQEIVVSIILQDIFELSITIKQRQIPAIVDLILGDVLRAQIEIAEHILLCRQYGVLFMKRGISSSNLGNEAVVELSYGQNTVGPWQFMCMQIEEPVSKHTAVNSITVLQSDFDAGLEVCLAQKSYYVSKQYGHKKLNRLYIDKKIVPIQRYTEYVIKRKGSNEVIIDLLTNTLSDCVYRVEIKVPYVQIRWEKVDSKSEII